MCVGWWIYLFTFLCIIIKWENTIHKNLNFAIIFYKLYEWLIKYFQYRKLVSMRRTYYIIFNIRCVYDNDLNHTLVDRYLLLRTTNGRCITSSVVCIWNADQKNEWYDKSLLSFDLLYTTLGSICRAWEFSVCLVLMTSPYYRFISTTVIFILSYYHQLTDCDPVVLFWENPE